MNIVEDALRVWRGAERLLESLPPADPDLTVVSDTADEVRAVYHDVTEDRNSLTVERLAQSQLVIDRADALIVRIQAKLAEQGDRLADAHTDAVPVARRLNR